MGPLERRSPHSAQNLQLETEVLEQSSCRLEAAVKPADTDTT